ncbi:MAG TPA: gamma-glutamyltransferase, partial [Clostridia bacterium]|nr:gamma-glutamyltransferase [Clostridia bacterium]
MNCNLRIRFISILIFITFGLGIVACQIVSVPPPSQNNETKQRSETSKNGVVSAANPDAAAIGVSILESGGNAVDAAVAVSFALGLVEPHASGPGGCGYALYAPHNGEALFFDYRSVAPMAIDAEAFMLFSEAERKNSIKAAGIPGAVAGWLTLHEAYGSMPLAQLLEPTISLAEDGFKVTQTLSSNMSEQYEKLSADEVCSELYLNSGLPYSVGDILKNPDYGKMLRLLSQFGAEAFYNGEIANAIVFASEQKDG